MLFVITVFGISASQPRNRDKVTVVTQLSPPPSPDDNNTVPQTTQREAMGRRGDGWGQGQERWGRWGLGLETRAPGMFYFILFQYFTHYFVLGTLIRIPPPSAAATTTFSSSSIHSKNRSFFLSSCFLYLPMAFYLFLGSIYVLKAHGGFEWVTREETGPNDASGVVWALGIFFFCFSCFLHTN